MAIPRDTKEMSLLCLNCGAPGKKKCSVCRVARYCSSECQRAHWKQHKIACAVDEQAEFRPQGRHEREMFNIDPACAHAGSAKAAQPPLLMAVFGVISVFDHCPPGHPHEKWELDELYNFCSQQSVMARDPLCLVFLAGSAVDAFGNDDLPLAQKMMRIAVFLEIYRRNGREFLEAVHTNDMQSKSRCELDVLYQSLATRLGMIEELRKRIICKCLDEISQQ